MKKKSLRYRADRAAQGFTPLRRVDAFGLRHPTVNRISFVVLTVFFGVLIGFATKSVVLGVVLGVAIGLVTVLFTRANHRRRVENGTSAQFGPPQG